MISVLIAGSVGLIVSLLGTPFVIRLFRSRGYGQEIRADGPTTHQTKRGTPTMGGTVIILATLLGYAGAHVAQQRGPSVSGLLVLFVMTGLGAVGFLDDYIKIRKQRSLGLTVRTKFIGEAVVAVIFSVFALRYANAHGWTPASSYISFVRDTTLSVGPYLFPLVGLPADRGGVERGQPHRRAGRAGGGQLGDGVRRLHRHGLLDVRQRVLRAASPDVAAGCYIVRDPLDISLISAAAMGACFGFLWWNAAPAKIFMGDTGSLALGGAFASIAMVTRTELLLMILGGLFVMETLSVILQVLSFKTTGRRMFNMAPVHHHFELAGWPETTVIIRFWILAGLAVAFGLGLFYAEFLSRGGP